MKPCPECGNKDYTYRKEGDSYFLLCTACGYYAEGEKIKELENQEEDIVDNNLAGGEDTQHP
jgi:translation initiation factor 2 beta subunit (eIF-2beta)/eIF-5